MMGYLSDIKNDLIRIRNEAMSVGMPAGALLLVVDVMRQKMYVIDAENDPVVYPVSTSQSGLGERFDSNQTPRGFHRVVARYGDGLPAGAILKDRKPDGTVIDKSDWRHEGDYEVLTRIFRLRGMQPGLNAGEGVDSYERLVYIHGTNQEQYCGVEPSSHGCVRMRNEDIIQLYDDTAEYETWCWIGNR